MGADHRFFEPAMDASAKARLTNGADLRQALADGGFEIHYQPLVNLRHNERDRLRSLLRWRHPNAAMISLPNSSRWRKHRPDHESAMGAEKPPAPRRRAGRSYPDRPSTCRRFS